MALDQAETFEWLRNRVQELESELASAADAAVLVERGRRDGACPHLHQIGSNANICLDCRTVLYLEELDGTEESVSGP